MYPDYSGNQLHKKIKTNFPVTVLLYYYYYSRVLFCVLFGSDTLKMVGRGPVQMVYPNNAPNYSNQQLVSLERCK